MHALRCSIVSASLVLLGPAFAHAGMPSLRLTDIARVRLESISFFLVGFLLCSLFIQLLWNWLRKDFTRLPRLSYPKALGVVTLWGLLFVLVLTMISGARELMTPGAWEKSGLTYRLAKPDMHAVAQPTDDAARREALDRLRVALWKHAKSHGGLFPESVTASGFAPELWHLPGPSGLTFLYVGGHGADEGELPLAYEPEVDGSQLLVLLTSGEIRRVEWRALERMLAEGKRP